MIDSAVNNATRQRLLIGVALIILSGLVAGAILPMTTALAGYQDGDGILTSLISTQKLTWYFWGQDRLLNFIPALASPFSDVENNLRFQVFLRSVFAYLSPLGILIFFTRSPKFLLVAIAITNVIVLCSLSQYAQFNFYVQHNTFGTSLVLLTLAYSLTYSRLSKTAVAIAGLLIMSVAYATNYALLTYSIPVIAMLGLLRRSDLQRYVLFFIINCVAILIARLHSKAFGEPSTEFGLSISWQGVIDALQIIYQNLNLAFFLVFVAVAAVCYFLSKEKSSLALCGVLCLAISLIILLANTLWVQMNLYNVRYFLTSIVMICSVLGFLIARALMQVKSRYALLIPGLALTYCVFFSLCGFSATYNQLVGAPWRANSVAVAKLAVSEKVRVITGVFWDVWPAVYEAKHLQPSLPVFGAALRGLVLRNDFLAATKGQGEMTALCFLDTSELCANEITGNLQITGDSHLVIKRTEPTVAGDKKLLKLVFEIN